MPTDYLALRTKEAEDAEQHGVKGMHWGVIRDTATKARDHLRRKSKGEETTPTKKAAAIEKKAEPEATHEPKQVVGAASGETSSARYARLTQQVKEGRASDLSEQDLKFVNARTQALQTINKMNETQPGWLSKTSKQVLQNAAQKTMQDIANGVAGKYVSGPILDSLNKEAGSEVAKAAAPAAKAAAPAVKTAAKSTPTVKSPSRTPGMTSEQSTDWLRNFQKSRETVRRTNDNNLLGKNKELLDSLRKQGII